MTETGGKWPDFTFFNPQGNRWTLNRIVDVLPDGSVTYLEHFSTNFQPNFDFTLYPLHLEHFFASTQTCSIQTTDTSWFQWKV